MHCSDKVDDVPVVQVVVGGLVEGASDPVHRQRSVDLPVCNEMGFFFMGMAAVKGFSRFVRFFRGPPGCPGVKRQFSEPSTTKSSSLSRAPAQFHAQHLST